MVCNKCGMNNLNDANFCIGCGNDLRNPTPINNVELQNNSQVPLTQNSMPNNINVFQNNIVTSGVDNVSQSNDSRKKVDNKKLLIVVGIAVVLIIGGIILGISLKQNKPKSTQQKLEEVLSEDNLILVLKNDLYGYIDSKGNEVIEFKYDHASDFVNGKAIVQGYDNEDNYRYYIIDTKGKVLLKSESYESIQYIPSQDMYLYDGSLYNSDLKRITDENIEVDTFEEGFFRFKDGEMAGIMDATGKVLYKVKASYVYGDVYKNLDGEFYAEFHYDDKETLVDLKTGNELMTLSKADNKSFYEYNGIINIIQNEPFETLETLYLRHGKIAFRSTEKISSIYIEYPDVLRIHYGSNYEELGKEQSYYYYDLDTNEMLTEMPEDYTKLKNVDDWFEVNGYKEKSCSGNYGVFKGKKEIVPCEFDDIEPLIPELYTYIKTKTKKELVKVKKDEKVSLYNIATKEIIFTFEGDSLYNIYSYLNSTFIVERPGWFDDIDKIIVYNAITGKSKKFEEDANINMFSNYMTEVTDGKTNYYNTDLELIYTVEK